MWGGGAAGDAALDAAELKLLAERRLGELLEKTVSKGGKSESKLRGGTSMPLPPDVTKTQSHRWQTIAGLPKCEDPALFSCCFQML